MAEISWDVFAQAPVVMFGGCTKNCTIQIMNFDSLAGMGTK